MIEKMGMKVTVEAIHRDKDGNIINHQKHVFDPKIERINRLIEQLGTLKSILDNVKNNEVND